MTAGPTTRLEAIRLALDDVRSEDMGGEVVVCYANKWCQNPASDEICDWCYRVPSGDLRTAEEIEEAMKIQERGN